MVIAKINEFLEIPRDDILRACVRSSVSSHVGWVERKRNPTVGYPIFLLLLASKASGVVLSKGNLFDIWGEGL